MTEFKLLLLLICLNIFATTQGCGPTAFGQARTVSFTVTGSHLPAAAVYSENNAAKVLVPMISASSENVMTLVRSFVRRSVEEALYRLGRSAGLPDDAISLILQQLTIDIRYTPLKCDMVTITPMMAFVVQILMILGFKLLPLLIWLSVFTATHGCGPTAFGQARTVNFTVTGSHLPAAAVYSEDNAAKVLVPMISTSSENVVTLVRSFVRRSVEEALYRLGRSASLLDDAISLILQQLTIDIRYTPLKCDMVTITPTDPFGVANMKYCVIVGGIVTSTCMDSQANMCTLPANAAKHMQIDRQHLTISGSITTTNIIMASWSNQMWQNVLNTILRSLASGPFGSFVYGVTVAVN